MLDDTLDRDTRARLAAQGVNVGRHLLPGRGVLLAGIKTGLLLRRLLQLVGVTDAAGRAGLDERVMRLPDGPTAAHALHVTGADNSDGVLSVRADGDGLSPELFFAATLEHCTETLAEVLARMDAEVGPADRHRAVRRLVVDAVGAPGPGRGAARAAGLRPGRGHRLRRRADRRLRRRRRRHRAADPISSPSPASFSAPPLSKGCSA